MSVSNIIATPAHPQANSYVTVAEATQYFADRDNSTSWTGASADQKSQALIEATRLVDAYRFHGCKLKEWQRLEFPRYHKTTVLSLTPKTVGATTLQNDSIMKKMSYPPDFFKYGAVWFYDENQAAYGQFRLVTAFDHLTGILTLESALSPLPDTLSSFQLWTGIPYEVKWAVCETALAIIEDLITSQANGNIKRQKLDTEEVEYFDQSIQEIQLTLKAKQLLLPYINTSGRSITTPTFR